MLDPARSGGTLVDLMIHDFDLARRAARAGAAGARASGGGRPPRHGAGRARGRRAAASRAAMRCPASYPFTAGLRVLCERGVLEHRFVAARGRRGRQHRRRCRSVLGSIRPDGEAREFAGPARPVGSADRALPRLRRARREPPRRHVRAGARGAGRGAGRAGGGGDRGAAEHRALRGRDRPPRGGDSARLSTYSTHSVGSSTLDRAAGALALSPCGRPCRRPTQPQLRGQYPSRRRNAPAPTTSAPRARARRRAPRPT